MIFSIKSIIGQRYLSWKKKYVSWTSKRGQLEKAQSQERTLQVDGEKARRWEIIGWGQFGRSGRMGGKAKR